MSQVCPACRRLIKVFTCYNTMENLNIVEAGDGDFPVVMSPVHNHNDNDNCQCCCSCSQIYDNSSSRNRNNTSKDEVKLRRSHTTRSESDEESSLGSSSSCWNNESYKISDSSLHEIHHGSGSRYFLSSSSRRRPQLLFFLLFLLFPILTMSNPIHGGSGSPQDLSSGPSTSSSSSHHHKHNHHHGGSPSSSPTANHHHHERPAKWINPCRIPSALPQFPVEMLEDIEIVTQSDTELVSNIITQVNKAEFQAKKFMGSYYHETFGEDLSKGDRYSIVHYDFLKEINDKVKKSLGEKVSEGELEKLKFADALTSMYTGLQMFAVGLEQIVLDQAVYSGSFHKEFQETEYQLKYVLCELQIAMLEKGIHHEDVTREIMSSDHRDIDCDTVRNIRDWVIYRDYVNTLEYIRQTFSHFLNKLEHHHQP